MKRLTPKNKAYLGYILYGALLTICLLYLFFPSEAVRDYLVTSVGRVDPRLQLSVEDVRPSLMLGMKFRQAELSLREKPDINVFFAESLMIRPRIWAFLTGKSAYSFNCNAYGGNIKGRVRFLKNGVLSPFSARIKLKNVIIDEYDYLSELTGHNSSGILDGTISYRGLTDGTGEANLKITDGRVALPRPFLNLDAIEFDELLVKLIFKEQKLELSHVKLNGRDIQGTLSGKISLKRNYMKSGLDLKGTIELFSTLFKSATDNPDDAEFHRKPLKFKFTIYGTIAEPKFKLI